PSWQEHGAEVARMTDLDVAGVRIPPRAALQTRSGEELWPGAEAPYVDRFVPGSDAGDGMLSLRDVRPEPRARALDLVRYVRAVRRTRALPQQAALDEAAVTALVGMGGKLATRRDKAGLVRARLRAPAVVPPDVARLGAALYARHCASCHGAAGRGDGPAAAFLDTPPTDLVTARFKYRSTRTGAAALLTDVFRTVRHGLPGSGMTGMRHAPPAQVWAVVLHVRGLATGARGAGQPASLAVPPLPTLRVAAEDDRATYARHVARGKALFVAFECSRCHGTEGRGDGPDAIVEWSDGRQVRARDFKPRDVRDDPRQRMRGGARPADLWRTVMTGLDAAGMPGVHAPFEAARAARAPHAVDRRLVQPLKDPALFAVGVTASRDGPYEERIDTLHVGAGATGDGWRSFGDDWALVLYLLHLMRTEDEVQRDVMAWPQIEVRK
ncbi:MAG: c-type cytochrome, partial [Planctomycetota bacterium]|nr:c-type cytochrome [Planctomycetota bacterium]